MLKSNISLHRYSNYHIGGPAAHFYSPRSVETMLTEINKWRNAHSVPEKAHHDIFVLGGGTNVLISDEGYDGLVVRPGMASVRADDVMVHADAGISVEKLLDFTIANKLSGLEWAGGLPGTVGGAIRGNAGAFGGEMKDIIKSVTSVDIADPHGKPIVRTNNKCGFGYRTSVFKQLDKESARKEVIVSAVFGLSRGSRKSIREAIEDKIQYRAKNHPIEYPNVGSIFKNVPVESVPEKHRKTFAHIIKTDPFPVVPTAYIIAQTGLKGVSYGGAMISAKHSNFIVNVLNAKASDVKRLIELVKHTVKGKYGINLEEEVVLL